jgi:hypothetical protein
MSFPSLARNTGPSAAQAEEDGNVCRILRFEIPAGQQPTTLTVDGGRLAV